MKMYGVALFGHSKVYIAIYFSPFFVHKNHYALYRAVIYNLITIYSKPICIKAEDTKQRFSENLKSRYDLYPFFSAPFFGNQRLCASVRSLFFVSSKKGHRNVKTSRLAVHNS